MDVLMEGTNMHRRTNADIKETSSIANIFTSLIQHALLAVWLNVFLNLAADRVGGAAQPNEEKSAGQKIGDAITGQGNKN